MSVLFCHDHRFVIRDGCVYAGGALNARTFAAYREVFGEVTIAARVRELRPGEDVGKLNRCLDSADHFLPLPNFSTMRNLLFPERDPVRRLRAAIAEHDIVVARLPSEIGLLALREARRMGKPAIVEVVASVHEALSSHGGFGARPYAPVAERRMRRAVAAADYVHYVSSAFLQRRYPTAGMTAGISDVQIERPDPAVLEQRLATITDERPLVFGMIAVLQLRQKGADVAIRALALARKTDPGLTLKVLGPGDPAPWKEVAEAEGIGDAVEFCGPLPSGAPVLEWLSGIDVYVQASYQEGLPRALIEAMRQATPALASDAGGTGELIAPNHLHTPGDATRLAGHMLAARPAARRIEMARDNFAAAIPYSLDEVERRRADFWRAVLARSGAMRAGADGAGAGAA